MLSIREYLEDVVVLSVIIAYNENPVVSYTGEIANYYMFEDGTFSIQFEDDFALSFSRKNGYVDEDEVAHLFDGDMEVSFAIIERA